jgi:hypothetical protein
MRWLIVLVAACSAGSPGPGIDVDRAIAHVGELCAIGPRPGDGPEARRAAAYIDAQLEVMGLRAERLEVGAVDLPAIDVLGTHWRSAHRVETTDPDLIIRFGPPGRALVITAHYDTVVGSPGAVDNAAAVAILIELARVLRDQPPPQSVILAFTANEEIGLVGAEALAERMRTDVDFAIALDLVGGSGPLVINGASTLIGKSELAWIADAADRAGVAITAPPVHRVISRWWPQAERADHGAFTRRGIRAVHFYDRGQDGERIDLAYHSARDVPARVDRASVAEVGRLLRALAAAPPPAHDGDGYWIPTTRTVVPRWTLVAFELLLAAAAVFLLVRMPRGKPVARPRTPLPRRLRNAGLVLGLVCYALAVAAAIGLERAFAADHPMPWIHAPLRAELAETALVAGAFGLVTRVVGRFTPWIGERRYLALATILLLGFGGLFFALGAPELAWVWLVPAVSVTAAPRLPRMIAPVALIPAILPVILVLAPAQLREAAFNGFLPPSLPLAAWIGVLAAPSFAAVAWYLRPTGLGPLRSFVLSMGCALAVLGGAIALGISSPACSAAEFHQFHLACEQTRTWP